MDSCDISGKEAEVAAETEEGEACCDGVAATTNTNMQDNGCAGGGEGLKS